MSFSPNLGRWLQQDPIGFTAGDSNLYRFVGDDPTTHVDPSGLIKVTTLSYGPGPRPDSYFARWNFALDKPAPQNGYIVQKVTMTVKIEKCDGTVLPGGTKTYWEAWFIKQGQTRPTTQAASRMTDEAIIFRFIPGTCGRIKQTGKIKFFYATTTGNLGDPGARPIVPPDPKTGWETNASGKAGLQSSGVLPSILTMPTWWDDASDNGEKTGYRKIETKWCDCPGRRCASRDIYPPRPNEK